MKVKGVHLNDMGKPVDRFDLEQKIMEAWHVVDDLRLLTERLEHMNEDQVFSAVHGLQIFADMRFNNLWNTFEQCISNRIFESKDEDAGIILWDIDTDDTMHVSPEFVLHENP